MNLGLVLFVDYTLFHPHSRMSAVLLVCSLVVCPIRCVNVLGPMFISLLKEGDTK